MWLTYLFLTLLVLRWLTRIVLIHLQLRHIHAHQHAVPLEFENDITLAAHQKAAQYNAAKLRMAMLELSLDAIVLLYLTYLGGLNVIQHFAYGHFSGLVADAVFLGVLFLGLSILDVPLSYWRQFKLEAQFGFNRMTPEMFFGDIAKGMLLSVLLGGLLVVAVLMLMQHAHTNWWLYAWVLWLGFQGLLMWAYPTFIVPLFNNLSLLPEGEIKTNLNELLTACAFESSGMYVMDGSKRSAHANAFLSGLGKSKRIILFDTLVEKLNPKQLRAVLAHELGHYAHKHIQKQLLFSGLASLIVFAAIAYSINSPLFFAALGVDWPINHNQHAVGLALFILTMPVFLAFIQPLANAFSRRREFEADAFAARHANTQDLIGALLALYRDNASTLTPHPWYSAWHDSHPNASQRIQFLQKLKPTTQQAIACSVNPNAWANEADIQSKLPKYPGWAIFQPVNGPLQLKKTWQFQNFDGVQKALNAIIQIANTQDHHPEVHFGYNQISVAWSTHSTNGISDNDWVCCALCDKAIHSATINLGLA